MNGMDAATGKALSGDAHLAQSVRDLLTTPIGSRVGRRDYGSELPFPIDRAWTAATRLRVFAATAVAVLRFEPRLRLTAVEIAAADRPGASILTLAGERTDLPTPARLTVAPASGDSRSKAIFRSHLFPAENAGATFTAV